MVVSLQRLIGAVAAAVLVGNMAPVNVAMAVPATPQPDRVDTCTIIGTTKADRLVGTPRADVICGLGGADVVLGGGGPDLIVGGPGGDVLSGGRGPDTVDGGPGADVLAGQSGGDRCDRDRSDRKVASCLSDGRGPRLTQIQSPDVIPLGTRFRLGWWSYDPSGIADARASVVVTGQEADARCSRPRAVHSNARGTAYEQSCRLASPGTPTVARITVRATDRLGNRSSRTLRSTFAAPSASTPSPATSEAPTPEPPLGPTTWPEPVPPPASVGMITANNFGIHSYQGKPGLSAAAIRLNCFPLWRDMNPQNGAFDWSEADREIARVRSYGYDDITFSFCGTPQWAASGPVPRPDREYWGPLSTAPPADMNTWRTFVRTFVARYAGAISSYEAWNEATSPYLWQGSADQMAQMTKILYDAVRDYDPSARVLSANSQMGEQPAWFESFFPRYMKGLASRGWPVDAVTVHTYSGSPTEEGLLKRSQVLDHLTTTLQPLGKPERVELWDTETNFLSMVDDRTQQAVVARSFLDSWRQGIKRTYWYMWVAQADPWLGIQLTRGSPGTVAYEAFMEWTVGSQFRGCAVSGELRVCEFERSTGDRFHIVYATSPQSTGRVTLGSPTVVCEPTGAPCRTEVGGLEVGFMPLRVG